MHKAIEYAVEFDKSGRLTKRRWSIGPVLITTAAGVFLTLTGHTIWAGIGTVLRTLKWR
jgi:hypothetical protein